jgi:hypothetical protein
MNPLNAFPLINAIAQTLTISADTKAPTERRVGLNPWIIATRSEPVATCHVIARCCHSALVRRKT